MEDAMQRMRRNMKWVGLVLLLLFLVPLALQVVSWF
jgi:hypothetical protein